MTANPWLSYRLRKASGDDPVVAIFGGHPRGVRSREWPRCKVCGAPLCHMAQFDAGPHLDLGGHARLTLFICHATGGRCEDWDPYKGSNRVLLHRELDDNPYDGPPTVRVYRKMRLAAEPAIDEKAIMKAAKAEGRDLGEVAQQLKHDKIGGGAVWLHGDQTPRGADGERTRLAIQLTTEIVKFDITPGGMGYVFLDPRDPSEQRGYFVWQGG